MKAQRKKLPQKALDFLDAHYPNSRVESVKVKQQDGPQAAYHVIAHRDGLDSHMYFDASGEFIQRTDTAIDPEEYYEMNLP